MSRPKADSSPAPDPDKEPSLLRALDKAVGTILGLQKENGCWDVPCETDPSPTAIHLLLRRYLGRPDATLESNLAAYIRAIARPEGGWAAFPGGPADPDVTILCLAALQAAGDRADESLIKKAGIVFRDLGGWPATSFYGRLMPAFLGQIPLRALPAVTPAVLVFPRRFPLHPDRQPMHVRTTIVPLAYLIRKKAVRPLPEDRGIAKIAGTTDRWSIWPEPTAAASVSRKTRRLRRSAEILGKLSGIVDRIPPPADWETRVLESILETRNADGTFGGIFLSTALGLMALDNISGEKAADLLARGLAGFEGWLVTEGNGRRQQFGPSTTCMTAFALQSIQAAGVPSTSSPVRKGGEWLVRHQSQNRGEWARRISPMVQPGGWSFGAETNAFPDCDTTSSVLAALAPFRSRIAEAFDRGVKWLLALQDRNGGWAAWDRGNKSRLLFPSGSFVSYEDLPDPEITARVLCVLGPLARIGQGNDLRRAIQKALTFLWRSQRRDGSWPGHWVVNFTAGTGQALQGVAAAGVRPEDRRIGKAVSWLLSVQNADGGWGESKESYRTGRFEPGESNAFVTATVLRGLSAAGQRRSAAIRAGITFLLRAQDPDGLWPDPEWNGIALPGKAYFLYSLVPTCAAVIAIADFLKTAHPDQSIPSLIRSRRQPPIFKSG
jgi:squalene-hopene/tetraprenyl-beta-curcumene cyclase